MRVALAVVGLVVASSSASSGSPSLPIKSGTYQFWHRDVEFPSSKGFRVTVTIRGNRVSVVNKEPQRVFPLGVIEEGTLMWHPASMHWIVGHSEADEHAAEVGGCSDGPHVIDLRSRILWTCEGGP